MIGSLLCNPLLSCIQILLLLLLLVFSSAGVVSFSDDLDLILHSFTQIEIQIYSREGNSVILRQLKRSY